jgi:hypothetical protein
VTVELDVLASPFEFLNVPEQELGLREKRSREVMESAEQNLGLAEATLSRMQVGSNTGVVPEEHLAHARLERAVMERQVTMMRLDVDEQRITGLAPRHDLAAPLVDGQDFADERLRLQGENLQDELTRVGARSARLAELVQLGTVEAPQLAMSEAAQATLDRELNLTSAWSPSASTFWPGPSTRRPSRLARHSSERAPTPTTRPSIWNWRGPGSTG